MPDMYFDVDTAITECPVNIMPLIDDTDFKTIEGAVAYNAAGMALRWHFVTSAGAYTVTSVTPTTAGDYDWTDQGDSGIYTIEIPASGGASINNDTEGYGWFTGVATGVLPWRGPTIGFRAAGLNDLLCDSAYSTTRGLAGTALPAAAADAAGGIPISDAGGLDMDSIKTDTAAILTDTGTSGVIVATNNDKTGYSLTATTGLGNQTADITGNLSGSVGSVTGAVGSVTGSVGSVTGLTASNLDAAISTRATPAQILTTALTESYAADGAAPTVAQALFLIQQSIGDFSISGTTLTVNKLDGTTAAATYTLDSATDPTSRTRAT